MATAWAPAYELKGVFRRFVVAQVNTDAAQGLAEQKFVPVMRSPSINWLADDVGFVWPGSRGRRWPLYMDQPYIPPAPVQYHDPYMSDFRSTIAASTNVLQLPFGPLWQPGDLVVLVVMARYALTAVPAGFSLKASIGPVAGDTTNQFVSIYTKRMTDSNTDPNTTASRFTFTTGTAGRMAIGAMVFRGASDPVSRPDLSEASTPNNTYPSFTLKAKAARNLVVRAVSVPLYSATTTQNMPYASVAVTPISSSPPMFSPVWYNLDNANTPRLALFLDYGAPVPHQLVLPSLDSTQWYAVALELPGSVPV